MPGRPQPRQDLVQALVQSVIAHPDAENMGQLMRFVAHEADAETAAAICRLLAERLSSMDRIASPLDVNAVVLDPRFRVDGSELVFVRGKNIGYAMLDSLPEVRSQLQTGDQVALQMKEDRGLVISRRIAPYPASALLRVDRVLSEHGRLVAVDHGGGKQVLFMSEAVREHPDLGPGAEVLCAPEVDLALEMLAPAQDAESCRLLADIPDLSLADLGGLPEVRSELAQMLALMTASPADLAAYGLSRSQVVLFEGSPGTGKTYAALILASLLKKRMSVAVLFVRGPEFLNPYLGATESAVRGLFAQARRLAPRHDMVLVIWDEFEALFYSRSNKLSGTMADQTLVPTFLSMLDGIDKDSLKDIWLVCISNRPDLLDTGMTRECRIGKKILFGPLPDEPATAEVFGIHLRGRRLAEGLDAALAAERLAAYAFTGGPDGQALPVAVVRMHDERHITVRCDRILTGAIVKGAVDRAAQAAWWRATRGGPPGIGLRDLQEGLRKAVGSLPLARENLDEYLGWPIDQCARVVEVAHVAAA